jgi:hypothetical protein
MACWASVAVAAPGVVLAAGMAIALALGLFGNHPMWPDDRLNLSEAAAARDEAEVTWLIGYGEDPNVARSVRAGLLFDHAVELTPLEAAVVSQRTIMVERLLHNGVVMDARVWSRVRCLAGGSEMPSFLDRRRPPGAEARCDEVSLP